jgi:hypothetical protein
MQHPLSFASNEHTLDNAVALIRLIEPLLSPYGYHCGLTGGVLFKGTSTKDTDIILYPHNPDKKLLPEQLLPLLLPIGLTKRMETDIEYTHREVIICSYADRRIDLFLLN